MVAVVAYELAWAAGFFDGEGTVYQRSRRSKKEWNIEIAQLDRRPLDRFVNAVGKGKVISRNGRGHTKPHFMYVCYKEQDRREVIEKIWPFLSEPKQEQIHRVTGHGGSCGV